MRTVRDHTLDFRESVLHTIRISELVRGRVRRGVGFSSHFFVRRAMLQCVVEDLL
jgi:hypothetical protein